MDSRDLQRIGCSRWRKKLRNTFVIDNYIEWIKIYDFTNGWWSDPRWIYYIYLEKYSNFMTAGNWANSTSALVGRNDLYSSYHSASSRLTQD